jgi:hypothetical protein
MSNQGRSTYQATLDTASYFQDNTSELITEAKLRDSLTNLSDSTLFKKDDPFLRIVTATTGTEPAYVITLTNLYSGSYSQLMPILFNAHATNTGAATINVNSLGAKSLKRPDGTATQAGDIVSGQLYIINYDGTDFLIVPGFGGGTALAENSLLVSTTTVTSAQILALYTTPITLISAPGAGKFIVVHRVLGSVDYNTTPYSNGNMIINYSGGTTCATIVDDLLKATTDEVYYDYGQVAGGLSAGINESILITMAVATDPTGGDSDMKVKIWYTIESI